MKFFLTLLTVLSLSLAAPVTGFAAEAVEFVVVQPVLGASPAPASITLPLPAEPAEGSDITYTLTYQDASGQARVVNAYQYKIKVVNSAQAESGTTPTTLTLSETRETPTSEAPDTLTDSKSEDAFSSAHEKGYNSGSN